MLHKFQKKNIAKTFNRSILYFKQLCKHVESALFGAKHLRNRFSKSGKLVLNLNFFINEEQINFGNVYNYANFMGRAI